LEMTPLTQAVPEATSCQTTLPLLQRPNCFSPLQTTAPLVVQVPAAPPPVVGGEAGGAAAGEEGTAGVPVPGAAGAVGLAGVGAPVTVTRVVLVDVGAPDAPGAKTPPGLDGGAVGADEGAATGGAPPAG
jgi:hypothetical protein